jgi:hypothetical protein
MVRFSDPLPEPGTPGSEIARQSPDGKHIVVVTTRGLLRSNQIESKISAFDIGGISTFLASGRGKAATPRVVASIVSFPHRSSPQAFAPVIQDLCWSADSTHIYFKGESLAGAYQIYEANLDGSGFHVLTSPQLSVDRFSVLGNTIVYYASKAGVPRAAHGDIINADAQRLTGYSLEDVLFPGEMNSLAPETFRILILRHTRGRWISYSVPDFSSTEIPVISHAFPFTPSPKADKLVVLTPVLTVPKIWEAFDPAEGSEAMRLNSHDRRTSVDNLLRPARYSLIDLQSGAAQPLIDAPNARVLNYNDQNRLAWAPDERRVLVTNTFLPRDKKSQPSSNQTSRPCAVASVDLPSMRTRCFFFETRKQLAARDRVLDVSFGDSDDVAVVRLRLASGEESIQHYRLDNDVWALISSEEVGSLSQQEADGEPKESMPRRNIEVSVRQSYNEPPALWAFNGSTGTKRLLWDPNPQFAHIRFGEASDYNWKDNSGHEWNGVLVKPVGYIEGKRYPLILQMYSFVRGEFVTDGLYPTAFAARELASDGFVVMQIKKKPTKLSEEDPKDHLEGYRSAIESLDRAGLIERDRVGVVGFSWTCWYAINALIKDPKLFAAATIADGLDNSYMQYLISAPEGDGLQQQMDAIRGVEPFGPGLERWVKEAPGFNLDKVQTPVRIEAINPMSVLQEWELYASLRMQHKSVDLIYFPEGTHIHQKPLERLESQQGNVDWMRFWLQGYEDPDPRKDAQYKLWHTFRERSSEPRGSRQQPNE